MSVLCASWFSDCEFSRQRVLLFGVHSTVVVLFTSIPVLTGHRTDLVADRVRMINRLRDLLTSVFPALEREFDFASARERWCC